MAEYKSLLIGIDSYHDPDIPDFDGVIQEDFFSISSTLSKVGYQVQAFCGSETEGIGKDDLEDKIEAFFINEAGPEDTLLLYLSGHGIHLRDNEGEENYLIPSNAKLSMPHKFTSRFLALDFEPLLKRSAARNAIVLVDACREAFDFQTKSLSQYKIDEATIRKSDTQTYLIVFGCSAGREAYFHRDDSVAFSLMAKAFVDAINDENVGVSIEEVIKATDAKLKALGKEFNKNIQNLCYRKESFCNEAGLGQLLLYPGKRVQQLAVNPWREAVELHELWEKISELSSDVFAEAKTATLDLVDACWQDFQHGKSTLIDNPWWDPKLPIRVTERLGELFNQLKGDFDPGFSEILISLLSPFVRESLLAQELLSFSSTVPERISDNFAPENDAEERLEIILKSHAPLVRKTQQLYQQQKKTYKALAYWLIYKATKRSFSLWQIKPDSHLKQALDKLSLKGKSIDIFNKKRLVEFARIVVGDPERVTLEDGDFIFQDKATLWGSTSDRIIREKNIAFTLQGAGLAAIDSTILPDLLVDHLGLADPLEVDDIFRLINNIQWHISRNTWNLNVRCKHQALDHAIEKHTEHCNKLLEAIHAKISKIPVLKETISRLPSRFSCESLQPATKDGIPTYQKPHVHFHLEQQQVQQLLMGTQLYGDESLAIRELYQNALDACRYREARLKYLKALNPMCDLLEKWQPKIRFCQGKDEQGRDYIECYDSGIGMGIRELSGCFAEAGRRFHDTPQFIEEQQLWRKHNIELYPNSQFGVGVFSYFMLADEIHVTTARMDRKGKITTRITTRVSSAGSLFRITEEPAGAEEGTRIKLYLKTDSQAVSAFNTLTNILWVAEYPTSVTSSDDYFEWEPGILDSLDRTFKRSIFLPTKDPNFWWRNSYLKQRVSTNNEQIVLCDGIKTRSPNRMATFATINLKNKNYPKLTVDRRNLAREKIKDVSSFISEKIKKHALELDNKNFIDWRWLVSLSPKYPEISEVITKKLIESNINIKIDEILFDEKTINLKHIGLYKSDVAIVKEIIDNNESIRKKAKKKRKDYDFYEIYFGTPHTHLEKERRAFWSECILEGSSKENKYNLKNSEKTRYKNTLLLPKDDKILDFKPKKLSWREQLYIMYKNRETTTAMFNRIERLKPLYTLKSSLNFKKNKIPERIDAYCLDKHDNLSITGVTQVSILTECSFEEAHRQIFECETSKAFKNIPLNSAQKELFDTYQERQFFISLGFKKDMFFEYLSNTSDEYQTEVPLKIDTSVKSLKSKLDIQRSELQNMLKKFIKADIILITPHSIGEILDWYEKCEPD